MKTAAVIGARSMLGRELIRRLVALDIAVLTVGRSGEDDIHFDLTGGTFEASGQHRADTLFHCATAFADDSGPGVRENFSVNAASAVSVGELAASLGARTLVYAGTASSDRALDPCNFGSYGLTKAIAEQFLGWAMQKQGGRFCSLRFPQIYDTEGLCCRHQPWFGRIVAYTSRGQDIRMPPSLGSRNFLHVDDASKLMIRAATVQEASGELNVTHPQSLTLQQIAEIAYEVFGHGGRVVSAAEKTPFRAVHFADGRSTFRLLDLEPMIDMRRGLAMISAAGTATAFGPMDVT